MTVATTARAVRLHVYATLTGEWGWTCESCRAESRYVYGERDTAARHAQRHARRCRKARTP